MTNSYTTASLVEAEIRADATFSSSTIPSLSQVTNWIEEYSNIIEKKTNTVYSSTVVTSELSDYDGTGILRFPVSPLISVDKVEYNVNSNNVASSWVTLESGEGYNYLVYLDEGEIEFISGSSATYKLTPIKGKQKFRVGYTYGYSSTPLDIQRLCTLMVAKQVIRTLVNSEANTEGGNISVGVISVADPSNFTPNYLKQLDSEIQVLLDSTGNSFKTYRMNRVYD